MKFLFDSFQNSSWTKSLSFAIPEHFAWASTIPSKWWFLIVSVTALYLFWRIDESDLTSISARHQISTGLPRIFKRHAPNENSLDSGGAVYNGKSAVARRLQANGWVEHDYKRIDVHGLVRRRLSSSWLWTIQPPVPEWKETNKGNDKIEVKNLTCFGYILLLLH